jgi:glycosyltransferase involved in cell wall biosynthesis
MTGIPKWLHAYRQFRAGGIVATKRFLTEIDHNHAHVLSEDPPVVYLWWGKDDSALHRGLADQELTVLYLFPWCYSTQELPEICRHVQAIRTLFPKHRIFFLCNEEYSVAELRTAGINAEFIHQNAFINEDVFVPRPAIERTHDALYSASLAPYKRHSLASDVQSLIILSYTYGGSSNEAYSAFVRKTLAHAWWAKDSVELGQKLSAQQIVDLYARAHVGLCLSEIEGGMFVSMEYLLAGLPVVSTKSVGGRDTFWDERYVIVCDDSPGAVAEAVTALKHRCIAPEDVRRWTLEKIVIHRERLRILLKSLGADLRCPWAPGTHGTTTFTDLRMLGRDLRKKIASNLPK